MKVGDYCRTKNGLIGKIIKKEEYDTHTILEYEGQYCKRVLSTTGTDSEVIKSSPKIIDLIREGDLVNNHIVGQVFYENQTIDNIKYLDLEGVNILVCNDDIKSIVTKECFESMEYKVKE